MESFSRSSKHTSFRGFPRVRDAAPPEPRRAPPADTPVTPGGASNHSEHLCKMGRVFPGGGRKTGAWSRNSRARADRNSSWGKTKFFKNCYLEKESVNMHEADSGNEIYSEYCHMKLGENGSFTYTRSIFRKEIIKSLSYGAKCSDI